MPGIDTNSISNESIHTQHLNIEEELNSDHIRYPQHASIECQTALLVKKLQSSYVYLKCRNTIKSGILKNQPQITCKQLLQYGPQASWKQKRSIGQSSLKYKTEGTKKRNNLLEKFGVEDILKKAILEMHATGLETPRLKWNDFDPLDSIADIDKQMDEKLDHVRLAKECWENSVKDEVLAYAKENDWNDLAIEITDIVESGKNKDKKPTNSSGNFLYDRKDLLDAITDINSCNELINESSIQKWGMIQLRVFSPSLRTFKYIFMEIGSSFPQIGLDDYIDESGFFTIEKVRIGKALLKDNSCLKARQYSKTGCPVSLRGRIWRQALGCSFTTKDMDYFERLTEKIEKLQFVTDEMYRMDVSRIADDTTYFPFEESLHDILLSFARDTWVKEHSQLKVHCDVKIKDQDFCLPPSGIQPFSGLVMYAAPLCYLFDDTFKIYFVFRQMYASFWCKLNCIRSQQGTLLCLCKLFEDILSRCIPDTVLALVELGVEPLHIAYPWIQSAFSGFLDLNQVLLLWDRIIGYNNLDIIAIFAASLFIYRATDIAEKKTSAEVQSLFNDLLEIQVMPILQGFFLSI